MRNHNDDCFHVFHGCKTHRDVAIRIHVYVRHKSFEDAIRCFPGEKRKRKCKEYELICAGIFNWLFLVGLGVLDDIDDSCDVDAVSFW